MPDENQNQTNPPADPKPPTDPAKPTPPADPKPPENPPAPPPEETISLPKSAFDERLNRAKQAELKKVAKEFGFDDPKDYLEAAKTWKALADEKKNKEEAEKPELERLRTQAAEHETAAKTARAEAEKYKVELTVRDAATKSGVSDIETARALFFVHRSEAAEPMEASDFFADLKTKKAFLFGPPPKTTTGVRDPDDGGGKPKDPNGKKTADKMSDEEWRAYKASKGL